MPLAARNDYVVASRIKERHASNSVSKTVLACTAMTFVFQLDRRKEVESEILWPLKQL